MPDTPAPSSNGTPNGTHSAATPAAPRFTPPSESQWQDSTSDSFKQNEAALDAQAAELDASDDGGLAALEESITGSTTAVADEPTGTDESQTPGDEPNPEAKAEPEADDFNPQAWRQRREAEAAVESLLQAGKSEELVKKLWKTDKTALIEWAKDLSKPAASESAKAPESDPFAPIWDEAEKSLSEVFGADNPETNAILTPIKAAVAQVQKIIADQIGELRGGYDNSFRQYVANSTRIEARMAQMALASDWPKIKDAEGFKQAVAKASEYVGRGEKFESIEAMLEKAAKDLWGKEKEIERRKAMSQHGKAQSQGQPSAPQRRPAATKTGPATVSYDQWENGIYLEIAKAKREGRNVDQAVEEYKRTHVVKH